MQNEIWKSVPGFSRYEASSFGRVRSIYKYEVRILKPYSSSKGYLQNNVLDDLKIKKVMKVHRMVGLAFGIIEPHEWINHIDGVKTNNLLSNLEKTTPLENNRHAFRLGLNKGLKGEDHARAILSEVDIERIILSLEFGLTDKQVAIIFGIVPGYPSQIYKGETWKHLKEKLAQADGGEDEMKLNRAWAMPNHNTCEIGPIKPREFWVDPDISDFLPILDTNVHYAFSDRRNPRDIHVHEVLPETPSKDAETATEEYADKLWNKILREGKGVHAKTLIKYGIVEGQSMGESRAMKVIEKINYEYDQNIKNAIVDAERSRTREICEFLRSDKYKADVYADEIEKRFLK